ncbi:MAG: MmgE/PrpD family protein, partial [Burkholderiales bacterium]|nr:MmgE/PrpD family protein [Burkholderiales bacterium]
MQSAPDYLEQLARFVGTTPADQVPQAVRERAKWLIADSLPVYATGMRAAPMQALAARQMGNAAPGRAWVLGLGATCNSQDAAMLNGIAGAWLDFDEGNTLANGHPGAQVLPTALAMAQERAVSGAEFLATFALAYEVVARIGMATTPRLIVNPHGT